jgi:hypothetical protein
VVNAHSNGAANPFAALYLNQYADSHPRSPV